ncbi:cysteine synthase A [Arenicellales bacterium nBUS_48]|jgi:cysteine synthase|nr:cysteine synthase A [Pseudomonadota bacterium]|tara:strand:+ start:104 stop:1021 length:918 start_codon:yes stop_codon:yes gene_type:complete
MKHENILGAIGQTPVVKLNHFDCGFARSLWVKLESFNPGGSVKDRPALNMIEDAEARGVLKPGDTIIEPTSGNTGIGLAMVAAVKGYPAVFVMSADMSEERKSILLAYGATLVLTPAEKGTVGAIEEARRLAKEHDYFFVGQHFNPANPLSHEATATEILEDFGVDLGAVICTTGTGGTVSGISPILRSAIPDIQIIVTEPDESPMLSQGIGRKHRIMGTTPSFIPDTLDQNAYDSIISVNADDAIGITRRLAEEEGIFCGISCGAAIVGMLEYAKQEEAKDKQLLAILADTGERYLSTELWDST